jgi:Predicted membrane protein (DUF2142)
MQNGEDAAALKRSDTFSESSQRKIVWLFCLLAAIHVFIFSAAFPFFNNVDEPMHFDLVVKYSHGRLPQGPEMISPDAATYLALFASCAYFGTPAEFPGGQLPVPPWTESPQKMQQDLLLNKPGWQSLENYEVSQPPLYYALTGLLWRTGQRLGVDGAHLLYWLRFLNVVFIVALVALGYLASRMIFPKNLFIRMGAPALLALMPQTAFYSIGNDILSPLCFGAVFILLMKWLSCEKLTAPLGAATGLAFAATYLSKTTNLPLLAVAAAAMMLKVWQDARRGNLNTACPAVLVFLGCAALPIIPWIVWCESHFGDLTGSKLKIQHFGWTVKPFGNWWHHPIFTPVGLWTYLSGQLSTFWQGEFLWHNQPMALPGTNTAYTTLSLLLPFVALFASFRSPMTTTPQGHALLWSFLCFAAVLAFFGLLSTVYDFHDCPNPSREHPYFQAGRMLLGMLIPFLLLFVYGLDRLLSRFGNKAKFSALATIICGILVLEITTDWPVFSSSFNWYHLP